MTGKISQRVVARLLKTTRGFTDYAMLTHAYVLGRRAGIRAERKQSKAQVERLHQVIACLRKQLEPFRGLDGQGQVLQPDDVARREMWRAEQQFNREMNR